MALFGGAAASSPLVLVEAAPLAADPASSTTAPKDSKEGRGFYHNKYGPKKLVTLQIMSMRGWSAKKVSGCWVYFSPQDQSFADPDAAFTAFAAQYPSEFVYKSKLKEPQLLGTRRAGSVAKKRPASELCESSGHTQGGDEEDCTSFAEMGVREKIVGSGASSSSSSSSYLFTCEHCGAPHAGSYATGRFCNRSCSSSRATRTGLSVEPRPQLQNTIMDRDSFGTLDSVQESIQQGQGQVSLAESLVALCPVPCAHPEGPWNCVCARGSTKPVAQVGITGEIVATFCGGHTATAHFGKVAALRGGVHKRVFREIQRYLPSKNGPGREFPTDRSRLVYIPGGVCANVGKFCVQTGKHKRTFSKLNSEHFTTKHSGFPNYSAATRPSVVAENPGMQFGAVASELFKRWKLLSDEEKAVYKPAQVEEKPGEEEGREKIVGSGASSLSSSSSFLFTCEHCGAPHDGSFATGRFCDRSCSASRVRTAFYPQPQLHNIIIDRDLKKIRVKAVPKRHVSKQNVGLDVDEVDVGGEGGLLPWSNNLIDEVGAIEGWEEYSTGTFSREKDWFSSEYDFDDDSSSKVEDALLRISSHKRVFHSLPAQKCASLEDKDSAEDSLDDDSDFDEEEDSNCENDVIEWRRDKSQEEDSPAAAPLAHAQSQHDGVSTSIWRIVNSTNWGAPLRLANPAWEFPWAPKVGNIATDAEVLLYALLVLLEVDGDPLAIESFWGDCCSTSTPQKDSMASGKVFANIPTSKPALEREKKQKGVATAALQGRPVANDSVPGLTIPFSKNAGDCEEFDSDDDDDDDSCSAGGPYAADETVPLARLSRLLNSLFLKAKLEVERTAAGESKLTLPLIACDVAGQLALLTHVLSIENPVWSDSFLGSSCMASRLVTEESVVAADATEAPAETTTTAENPAAVTTEAPGETTTEATAEEPADAAATTGAPVEAATEILLPSSMLLDSSAAVCPMPSCLSRDSLDPSSPRVPAAVPVSSSFSSSTSSTFTPSSHFSSPAPVKIVPKRDTYDALLVGQREMYSTAFIPKGRLIPWMSSRLRLLEEPLIGSRSRTLPPGQPTQRGPAPYEFQFKWRGRTLVSTPNFRTPAPYCNDYCGPDRSNERKRKMASRQNLRFCVVLDQYSRPFIFLMATVDIQPNVACWMDYGDKYWKNWRLDQAALTRAHACLDAPHPRLLASDEFCRTATQPKVGDLARLRADNAELENICSRKINQAQLKTLNRRKEEQKKKVKDVKKKMEDAKREQRAKADQEALKQAHIYFLAETERAKQEALRHDRDLERKKQVEVERAQLAAWQEMNTAAYRQVLTAFTEAIEADYAAKKHQREVAQAVIILGRRWSDGERFLGGSLHTALHIPAGLERYAVSFDLPTLGLSLKVSPLLAVKASATPVTSPEAANYLQSASSSEASQAVAASDSTSTGAVANAKERGVAQKSAAPAAIPLVVPGHTGQTSEEAVWNSMPSVLTLLPGAITNEDDIEAIPPHRRRRIPSLGDKLETVGGISVRKVGRHGETVIERIAALLAAAPRPVTVTFLANPRTSAKPAFQAIGGNGSDSSSSKPVATTTTATAAAALVRAAAAVAGAHQSAAALHHHAQHPPSSASEGERHAAVAWAVQAATCAQAMEVAAQVARSASAATSSLVAGGGNRCVYCGKPHDGLLLFFLNLLFFPFKPVISIDGIFFRCGYFVGCFFA